MKNKNVHVQVGFSGVTLHTITTDAVHACLVFLIDGMYKDTKFGYLYHSNFSFNETMDLFSILKALLECITTELTSDLSLLLKENVNMNDLHNLYMLVGGGMSATRNNERNAVSLLINPNYLLYNYIKQFSKDEWTMLFYRIVKRTTIIGSCTE